MGTPQGSVISPLLANIYLHYVFDLWVDAWRKKCARGDVVVVRYADDNVLGFQYRADADRFLTEFRERLGKFGLELHPDKTRRIEFGRFAEQDRKKRGEGKPETFDFLGFTHISGKDRNGNFAVKRHTSILPVLDGWRARSGPLPVRRRDRSATRATTRANGCLAHGMKRYYGGDPRGTAGRPDQGQLDRRLGLRAVARSPACRWSRIRFTTRCCRRSTPTREMPVNCKVAAGRDESDFYEALGIVGEGPLVAYTPPHYEDMDGDGTAETFVGHTLDGQAHHGYPTNNYGLRRCLGADPAGATDFFSLDQSGNQTGGDWRKVYLRQLDVQGQLRGRHGVRRDPAQSDAKGLQLSKPGDHAMIATVSDGHERVGVDLARRARVRAAAHQPGLDRHQHAAPGARPPAGRGRHHAATRPRRDALRRAGRHRRRRDLQRAGHEAGRRRQRDAVQVPRRAAGGEAPARLAPGSADELPGLLHVRVRQAQDRRPRELLRRRGVHGRQHPVPQPATGAAQAVVQPPDRQLRGPGLRSSSTTASPSTTSTTPRRSAAARVRCS